MVIFAKNFEAVKLTTGGNGRVFKNDVIEINSILETWSVTVFETAGYLTRRA